MSLKEHLDKFGETAIVAGAARGLGKAFCVQLLQSGKRVIAIDSNEAALQSTSAELNSMYAGKVIPVVCDLSTDQAPETLMGLVREHECRLMIYNAAYGPVKRFTRNTREELDTYIDLNNRTLLHLAHEWAQWCDPDIPAGFLSMSSMAGIRGTLLVAPYAATKAFIWNLMEALYYEYRDTEVRFAAMCGGPIATENYLGTGPRKSLFLPKPDPPDYVARKALLQLGKRPVDVPGFGNRLSEFILTTLMPRRWASAIANSVMAKTYPQHWK